MFYGIIQYITFIGSEQPNVVHKLRTLEKFTISNM